MKKNYSYLVAAGAAVAGIALYYFLGKRKKATTGAPMKENERHHLTNAFSKAKQVATGG